MITHVTGTMIMDQCIDRVSRVSLYEGVTVGDEMINFCPWGRLSLQSESKLKPWMETWSLNDTILSEPKY